MNFQQKYRTIDCLIIDDIQFLENKIRTQEEFFHTFNALREANKQIIISSDRPPQYLDKLEERLRSRFANGLTIDIQPPDLETRIAILRKKAESEKVKVPNSIIQAVAQNIVGNIRNMEGALTRLLAYASLLNEPINDDMLDEVLKEFGNAAHSNVTMDKSSTMCAPSTRSRRTTSWAKTDENHCPASANRHVSVPDHDGYLAAAHRRTVRRPGPYDGHARHGPHPDLVRQGQVLRPETQAV